MLFQRIISDDSPVLFSLLRPTSDSHYELCNRYRDRQFILKNTHLFDNSFIIRLLY